MATERTAHVTWTGSLMEGGGTIDRVGSGAFGPLDVTWAARAEESNGRTSPEELIAAAHAACFSMALSHGLAQAGTPPERARDVGDRDLRPGNGDHEERADASAESSRAGRRPASVEAAEAAKENCPVSKALAAVPEITLDASLA